MMKNKIAIIIIVVLLAIAVVGSSFFVYGGDNEVITAIQDGGKYETGTEVINDRIFIDVVSEKNSYAIKVDIAGTVISNHDIRNSGPGLYATGIKVVANYVTIENCNVFDTPVGIAIWSSNNIIINCTFWNCSDDGIVLFGNTPRGCDNNTFINCVLYNCCDGIELQHSSNNTFINCRFLNNYHAGIDGIRSDNNDNSFFSCVFVDNMYGVYFQHSKDNKFVNCTFSENGIDAMER